VRKPWSGVELRHLAALAAVAEQGSFREAADSLGYVQSAVSQQLAQLERLLDLRLVERRPGRGRVRLTDAGALLLSHVGEILARFEAARADLDLLRAGRAGVVRLGVSESVATRLLPRLVARLRGAAPGLVLEIEEAIADDALWEMVEAGAVDAALGGLPVAGAPFEWVEVLEDPYVLVTATGSASAGAGAGAPLDPLRLSRLPLIEHRLMRHVQAQLGPLGFQPRYVFRSEVYSTVQALVAAGVGAAILPRLAVDAADEATSVLPLDRLLAPRAIAIGWNANRRRLPGLELMIDAARVNARSASIDPVP
jgi:DNA-binding transcriptional LysR family regulator